MELFESQRRLLEKSAREFDSGDIDEYINMAARLRVLLHEGKGESLFKQLGLKDKLAMLNTALEEEFWHGTLKIDGVLANSVCAFYLYPIPAKNGDPGPLAPLGEGSPVYSSLTAFEDWWQEAVFVRPNNARLSRKKLILTVANQEGGAHVDPKAPEGTYSAFDKQNAINMRYTETKPNSFRVSANDNGRLLLEAIESEPRQLGSPIPAAVRQIAYEVLETLKIHEPLLK